jgi:hypothetical protein
MPTWHYRCGPELLRNDQGRGSKSLSVMERSSSSRSLITALMLCDCLPFARASVRCFNSESRACFL